MVTEHAAKAALAAAGFPVTKGQLCDSEDDAVAAATAMGLPVVLKVSAPDILHKTEVGGVRANLQTAVAVRTAYRDISASVRRARGEAQRFRMLVDAMASGHEFFIGATRSEFGPLILFGLGGIMAEVFHDIAYGLVPLSDDDARRMIRSTKASALFGSFRGTTAVSEDVMAALLVKTSRFLEQNPDIAELDFNPVFAKGDSALIADARFLRAPIPSTVEQLRRPDDATLDRL
jgi:acyl-CoA synthetase (NDP forming)